MADLEVVWSGALSRTGVLLPDHYIDERNLRAAIEAALAAKE